jgi:hypothetical protein
LAFAAGALLAIGCGESRQSSASNHKGSGGSGGTSGTSGSAGTEPPNCGEREAYCNGACTAPGRTVNGCTGLATNDALIAMALDGTHVYLMDSISISRVPKAGGAVEPVVALSAIPSKLAVNASLVLWTESGAIRAIPKAGGAVVDLVTADGIGDTLAASDSRVFFMRGIASMAEIVSVDLAGGDLMVHATDDAVQGANIALDSTHFYWVHSNMIDPGELRRVPQTGTAVETVASAQGLYFFALGGSSVYYLTQTQFWRAPLAGGEPVGIHSSNDLDSMYFKMAANEQRLYWTGEFSVHKVGIDGSNPTVAAEVTLYRKGLEVDASGVYFHIESGLESVGVTTRIDL